MTQTKIVEGVQKSYAAAVPNISAAVLLLVNYATGMVGIGEVPPLVQVQAAIGLIVLALISKHLTWFFPNEKIEVPVQPEE